MSKASSAPTAQATTEEWRPASYTEYEVSSEGRVRRVAPYRSTNKGRILRQYLDRRGYLFVSMSSGGKGRSARVAHEVARAFIGPRPAGLQINHINCDKRDNRAANLEYVTQDENMAHAARHDLVAHGTANGNARLNELLARVIYRLRGVVKSRDLAALLGVSKTPVTDIWRGRSWRRAIAAERREAGA